MLKNQFFGTDGVRGAVGGKFINPQFARRLGKAAGLFIKGQFRASGLRAVIGRDTRASGQEIAQAVADGLASADLEVYDCGMVPTPAVAQAVLDNLAHIGVVITASHNPASDNGIKFFRFDGYKFSQAEEIAIEQLLVNETRDADVYVQANLMALDAEDAYIQRMSSLLPRQSLLGWRVALDTANGATYSTSRRVLEALGAVVCQVGCQPDGHNINDKLGSEHPEIMAELTREQRAKIGIAHDGDGDRLVLCDEHGSLLDGDEILALRGIELLKRGKLPAKTLVTTVMSNLGLDEAMEANGGKVERTAVGDRNVVLRMKELNAAWGGESSGHLVNLNLSTTGDGLLAALMVIDTMLRNRQPLSELRQCIRFYPQKKLNLDVSSQPDFAEVNGLETALTELEQSLGRGRLLLRYSGTEPKIRLLVEAADESLASEGMVKLEAVVRRYLPVRQDGV